MKKLGIYIAIVLVITIVLPTVIVKTIYFVPKGDPAIVEAIEKKPIIEKIQEDVPIIVSYNFEKIKVYNNNTGDVEEVNIDDYVKGVVTAEMPAEFHIEALKAQAVAARTYAISRTIRFKQGHPDHISAPLCTGIHCQAYLSYPQIKEIKGDKWIESYWGKIEEAVDSTKKLGIFYNGEIVEPLYHSTSGGRTEDVKDVYATEVPYLRSVPSPYEEGAPRFNNSVTLSTEEFIKKVKSKYPNVKLNNDNLQDKIKLIERTLTGRVKKIAIDGNVMEGRDLRDLFELNSTNFTIALDKRLNIIEIETFGYGHGVGMSQWGANGMGKNGSNFQEILKHYYTGVEIREIK